MHLIDFQFCLIRAWNCTCNVFRQAKLLSQAQALRHEAEMAVNEMEEAATTQLHNLANQSQVTLNSIEQRLTRSRERLEEFKLSSG